MISEIAATSQVRTPSYMEGRRELEDADDKQILSTINSPATRYGEGMDSITATSSAPSQSSGSKPDIPVEVVTRSRSVPTDFIYLVQKYRSKPESRKRFISNSIYGDGGARHDSPLISAINFGRKESVRKVLAREADVKALGCDALCTAARLGYWEIIEVLLESGADINITRDQPGVALIAAAGAGQLEIVQVLLAAGADVTVMHGYHATATALIVAACAGQLEIVQLLLAAGADVNITDDHCGTALIAAAGAGQLEIVQVLLAAGANVNVTDDYCGTALIVTAGAGQLETVKVLLAAGADFNITNGYRGTALHVAAAKGDLEMVGFLLDRGVDANIAAGWDGTALQAAAFYGYVPVMQILLENGADVNSRSGYWKSPLTAATYMGKEQAVQLLLEMGADPNSPMPEYETVGILEMARLRGFTKIVQMLVNRSGLVGFRESIRQQVVQPNQNKPCVWPVGSQLRVDARWEIPGMLKAMDPVNTQLAPVLTISGTLTKAEAATCEEYMKRRWPKSGHFLMTAISHAVTELCSGPSLHSTKLYRFFSSDVEIAVAVTQSLCNIHIQGEDVESILDIAEGLAWMCSAVRDSPFENLHYSDIEWDIEPFRHGSSFVPPTVSIRLAKLQPIESLGAGGSCWRHIFKNAVIAKSAGSPRVDPGFSGLHLEYEVMKELANVEYLATYDGGPVFFGFSSLLFPVARSEGKTIHWHLEICEDGQIQLSRMDEFSRHRLRTVSFEELKASQAILGWCGAAKVTLGTKPPAENAVTWSTAKPIGNTLERENFKAESQVSGSVMTILRLTAGISGQVKYKSNVRRFPKEDIFKNILWQASDPVILYDTSIRTAWLVPKLSVVLHMAHRYKSHWKLDVELPLATAICDGGHAAKDAISRGDNIVFDDGKYEKGKTLMFEDWVRHRWLALSAATTQQKEDPGVDMKMQPDGEIRGFDFMDLARPGHEVSETRTWKLSKSAGLWTHLLRHNPSKVQPVIFCANLGPAIVPDTDGTASQGILHNGCLSVPPNRDYLVSTVDSLSRMLEEAGRHIHGEMIASLHWHCPKDENPFRGCNHPEGDDFRWEEWHLQHLWKIKEGSKNNQLRRPRFDCGEGAIVFGKPSDGLMVALLTAIGKVGFP